MVLPTMFFMMFASEISSVFESSEQIVEPSLKTVIVSAMAVTSRSLWEIMMQVMPWSRSSLMMFRRFSESSSLSDDVGSSKIRSLQFLDSAFAISTSCCLPVLSLFTAHAGLTSSLTFFKYC